jgi:hypothetical protein
LETTLAHQDKEIKKLEITLARSDSVDVSVLSQQLDDARTHLASLEQGLRRKRGLLGVDEQLDLKRLQENNFLRMRMNALALKERIRDRLRQRKFEIEKLERNYRHSTNGMCIQIVMLVLRLKTHNMLLDAKLRKHAESSLKRREPAILTLTKNYNDLCRQLKSLINQKKAPLGAILPIEIPREGIFKLDVDDDIWQDIGLNDEQHSSAPLWLTNENVRQGIKSMLQLDRCEEEEVRLLRERHALQEWMKEEWKIVQRAKHNAGVCYFLIHVVFCI